MEWFFEKKAGKILKPSKNLFLDPEIFYYYYYFTENSD